MNSFVDLYIFLQKYENESIVSWLEEPWKGKDKQESLLRLFAGLGLIDKLNNYTVCNGNFNLKTVRPKILISNVFYDEKKELIKLKDSGDSSDLTCFHKDDNKHILVTTSKNINKNNVGDLDIDKILTNFQQYKDDGFIMTLCICIRNYDDFNSMKMCVKQSSKELKSIIDRDDTIVIDWSDLNQAYNMFNTTYKNICLSTILNEKKSVICLKMHQVLGVTKTLNMKDENDEPILWGQIQRSGKSFIICGTIIEDSKNKEKCNYLCMTTSPNETIKNQVKELNCLQLKDFNILLLDGSTTLRKGPTSKKNIIVCSKQYLQIKTTEDPDDGNDIKDGIIDLNVKPEKTRNISWLRKMKFDIRFLDESHNGGTTKLAKKTLEFYGNDAYTVHITATYSKPVFDYGISKKNWILWDLEDIMLCKNIDKPGKMERLIDKHGEDIKKAISKYSIKNIIEEYSKYPDLVILTDELNEKTIDDIITDTKNNNYGWSPDACFLLKQSYNSETVELIDEFQNETETLKMWYKIFGKKNKIGIPDQDYPDKDVFIKRIEKICRNSSINSRFIGDTKEPMVIMAFLPQKNIDLISKATIKLFKKNNFLSDYEVVAINSKISNDPQKIIDDARRSALNSDKKGVLVLSGKQCSLGVTIHNCDIVLLLNNNTGYDMITQMMFRCMTEEIGKKCGFVVDLNIHRVIKSTVMGYALMINPTSHPKEAVEYILSEKILNLNSDHWMPCFGHERNKLFKLSQYVYNIYSSDTENALKSCLDRLRYKNILLSKEDMKLFNSMFSTNLTNKNKVINTLKKIESENKTINKGIEKDLIVKDKEGEDEDEEGDEGTVDKKKDNFMDIFIHIIPLICLLTIHKEESSFIEMINIIERDKYVLGILLDQTKSWWGNEIDSKIINLFIDIYTKYIKKDIEITQIIRTSKEIFVKNVHNSKELSKLIDIYLIPQELEKKKNAEVSTPFELRQQMLDKIPIDFWESPKKVFEPCSGKGGFLLDIIDKFMVGLSKKIKDENQRYKTIVEECLYFSDINPTNIFICKLLLDPFNSFKLNFNEGNTLQLDIKEKWGVSGFNCIIGNPPYQEFGGSANGTLWDKFVVYSLNNMKNDGFLCFVHPSGWRNVDGKFKYLQKIIFKINLMYLEIHNESDGLKTFKSETRYDWYILKKSDDYEKTEIKFEDSSTLNVNIRNLEFIPNGEYHTVQRLLASDNELKCEVLHSESLYETRKKWVSKSYNLDLEFINPLVYTINSKSQIKCMYSSKINGHFGIPKLMWSNGRIKSIGSVIDTEGKYGLTNFAYGIVDQIDNLKDIKKAFDSSKFRKLMEFCAVGQLTVNYKILKLFKKDFWKEFI